MLKDDTGERSVQFPSLRIVNLLRQETKVLPKKEPDFIYSPQTIFNSSVSPLPPPRTKTSHVLLPPRTRVFSQRLHIDVYDDKSSRLRRIQMTRIEALLSVIGR